jgi:hypothetical protein
MDHLATGLSAAQVLFLVVIALVELGIVFGWLSKQ